MQPLLQVEIAPILHLRRAERRRDLARTADRRVTAGADELELRAGPDVEPRLATVLAQIEVVLHRLATA